MSQEPHNYDVPIELVFDITKASGQMEFLGLSERAGESGNELTGLFDWTCQACKAANQDTVTLKPQQVFFAKWTCSSCSRVTLVRFLARAVAEWIAQHTAVVAGRAVDTPDRDEQTAACTADRGRQTAGTWEAHHTCVGHCHRAGEPVMTVYTNAGTTATR